MTNIIINENGVVIAGVKINEEIFQEEKVDWRLESREDLIENLCGWIGEAKPSDKFLIKEDLKYLQKLDDEYVFQAYQQMSILLNRMTPQCFTTFVEQF